MSRTIWITRLWQPLKNRRRKKQGPPPRGKHLRPRLEVLEDRTLLSAPVSNTTDLIAAINNANSAGGATTITLASGTTFDFTSADNSTNGANALPVITGNITIVGNGDTLDGSKAVRLFDVASGGLLTLENATLTGGRAQGTGATAKGGAIYSSGTLTLSGVTLKSNVAQGSGGGTGGQSATGSGGADAAGGGLYVAGGTVTLSNDTLSNNNAVGGTGGQGGQGSTGSTGSTGSAGRLGVRYLTNYYTGSVNAPGALTSCTTLQVDGQRSS